ncbi:MAG: hypothetical protein PHE24_06065 [Patescibacteria group bacterium]|nr:hypothetical protein [Patescibacteria group bacterium]
MKIFKLSKFIRGWIIGNFEGGLIKTDQFELCLRKYQAGDAEQKHYHRIAEEITAVASGVFAMNGRTITEGDVVSLEPGEPADFECLRSGYTVVIKMPGAANDKYLTK